MSRNADIELAKKRNDKVTSLKEGDMGRIAHFINPVSGSHRFYDSTRKAVDEIGGKTFVSEREGQITDMVADALAKDPSTHIVVYGGDGSVCEAVNGIMRSGHADTAVLSVIPSGSGNDFSAYANDSGDIPKGDVRRIDLVKVTCGDDVHYFDNMMNIGFDCSVVYETVKIRKTGIIKGSAAYIAGVAKVLAKKKPIKATIELTECVNIETGEPACDFRAEKEILLTACANGQYCGGGFRSAPLARVTDGLMDVLVIDDVPVPKFVALVGDYRAGTFIDGKGELKKSFAEIMRYIRCRKMTVSGVERYCIDGELFETGGNPIVAEIVPGAVGFMAI